MNIKLVAMRCSLVDLSDELHLNIIQELLKHDDFLHEESLKPDPKRFNQDWDDDFQYHRDLMSWSSTSLYFRNLLAPYIFKSIKLRNDVKSGASVDAVLKSPHGALVKGIYFLGTIPPDIDDLDDDEDDDPLAEGSYKESDDAEGEERPIIITFPPVVNDLLSDLHQFPNLESLSIGFTYPNDDPFDEYYETEGIMVNENPTAARARKALMTTTYETLLRSKPPQLRAVEIRKFVWTFTEPYESQGFQKFLSHVEHFRLSVRGGNNGACWCVNTCDGYLESVARFDELFFDHLASATSLTLRATDEGPIGLEGMRHARLALTKEQMPLLQSLHLEHIFICQELVDFVLGHTDTLERLTLHDCHSSVNGLQDNDGFYWAHFFETLHGADLKKLSHLEICPDDAPLTFEPDSLQKEPVCPGDVRQIRRVPSDVAKRRVFGYAMLDDKYGECCDDSEENGAAFERGEDQAAFDRLMSNVNANAANRGGKITDWQVAT